MNPLLEINFRVPFDKIQASDVEPAMDELLGRAQVRLDEAIAAKDPLLAMDTMTENLDFAMAVVRHLEGVATTPELRAAYNAVQPKVSAFYSGLVLNEALWNAIKSYAATDEAKVLTGTMKRYLTKTVASFKRHGADLDPAGKARLKEIDVALAEVTTKFSENVLDSTNAWELVLTDEAKLAGLPPSAVGAARASAEGKGVEGWRFTLQGPSFLAVMTYLYDTSIREQVWRAFNLRGAAEPYNNRPLIAKILELRREKARLLGFKDFADLVLDDRMAHEGARAQSFLGNLREKTEKRFKEENAELEDFAGKRLEPWDIGYYAEKQRLALYDFDEEELRPYFSLDRVVDGMFEIFRRVFGIVVKEEQGVPVWDATVKTYAIEDSGSFYADWYPRENKRGGAWMDSLLPKLGLICGNLTPPVDGKPALLTHREVETIFHEFGHLLHHLLSRVQVRSLSGTSVAWDFVELPSQIMENWCWERESLDLFARHYETGELIPDALFEKMKRAKTFRAANTQMRQLGFGYVDLALHREWSPAKGDPVVWARPILQQFAAAPLPSNYAMITGFTHLFASPVAYGAGYYSYKWAEVLDADAFTRFKREGVFSAAAGGDFRSKILAKGDSEDPADLYRSFMGRDPDPRALLERAGLVLAIPSPRFLGFGYERYPLFMPRLGTSTTRHLPLSPVSRVGSRLRRLWNEGYRRQQADRRCGPTRDPISQFYANHVRLVHWPDGTLDPSFWWMPVSAGEESCATPCKELKEAGRSGGAGIGSDVEGCRIGAQTNWRRADGNTFRELAGRIGLRCTWTSVAGADTRQRMAQPHSSSEDIEIVGAYCSALVVGGDFFQQVVFCRAPKKLVRKHQKAGPRLLRDLHKLRGRRMIPRVISLPLFRAPREAGS